MVWRATVKVPSPSTCVARQARGAWITGTAWSAAGRAAASASCSPMASVRAGRRKPTATRLAARRGAKRASLALAHRLLVIAYHVLREGTTYEDLGEAYLDERDRTRVVRRSVQRLERLGYKVTVQAA